MTLQPLIPFEHQTWLEAIRLQAEAMRDGNQLHVCFRLEDPDASVRMPSATAAPERRDQLWQSTCFEVFFAVAGSPCYWELNLSPNGHWNAYRLEGYRQGLQPEPSISTLGYSLKRCSSSLELTLQLPLEHAAAAVRGPGGEQCRAGGVRHRGARSSPTRLQLLGLEAHRRRARFSSTAQFWPDPKAELKPQFPAFQVSLRSVRYIHTLSLARHPLRRRASDPALH
ncbi:MAG: hypothetical protein RLZZ11_559 [Cyanobacteriota bacterium]